MTKESQVGPAPLPDLARLETGVFHDGTFSGAKCRSCDEYMLPVQEFCSNCGGSDLTEESIVPKGRLYSFTTVHVSPTFPTPYSLGYVDLECGVRVLGQILDSANGFQCDEEVFAVALEDSLTGWAFAQAGVRA